MKFKLLVVGLFALAINSSVYADQWTFEVHDWYQEMYEQELEVDEGDCDYGDMGTSVEREANLMFSTHADYMCAEFCTNG